MRIVIIYLGRKGAGPVYSLELTRALLEQGVEILGIISKHSSNVEDWETLEHFYTNKQLVLSKLETYQNVFQFILRTLNPFIFIRIVKDIRLFSPVAVISTMLHPWHNIVFYLLKKRILRIKIIHDVNPHVGERSILHKLLNKWDIHTSDKWIVLTQDSKRKLQRKGVNPMKIEVIPHAHFGFYNKCPLLNNYNHKINYRIGFFGRIQKYKGIEILFQSYQQVLREVPQLKLLVAGSGKIDCKIPEGVELYNRWIADNEVANLLAEVDIVVLPYIDASQSGVIPLAFSLGKPVIATDVGGLSEQVPSTCGILVPPNSVGRLSESIIYLYNNPDKILKLGVSAYEYAYDHLDWKYSAKSLISMIQGK